MLVPTVAYAYDIGTKPYLPWDLDAEKTIYVYVRSDSEISQNKQAIISDVILSKHQIVVNDKIYFQGWQGALDQIAYSDDVSIQLVFTEYFRPNSILINLKDTQSKYDGYTNFALKHNKIIQSYVTIYDSQNLKDAEFEKILRHEMGHGLGLAHSESINDIMYPVLTMSNPYISNNYITFDNVSGLNMLYS